LNEQYELFDDPFKMLVILTKLIAEHKNVVVDFENIPSYENDKFLIKNELFIYKKDQTEISWYQYLGRDIHCNKNLTRNEYNKMFVDCMASLFEFN